VERVRSLPLKPIALSAAIVLAVVLFSAIFDISLMAGVVNGLQFGAVYALVGLGIALVYKSTKVMNFAQGEIGTMSAWLAWVVMAGAFGEVLALDYEGLDALDAGATGPGKMLIATVIAVLFGAGLSILVNSAVVQRVANASPVTSLVATVGIMLLMVSIQLIVFEPKLRNFPRFIDGAPPALDVGPLCMGTNPDGVCGGVLALGGIPIQWNTILVVLVLAGAASALGIFFRTPFGVALLATAQDPFAAEIQGVSVQTMGAMAWGMAGALAAIGGILGAGVFEKVGPGLMTTTFLIPALVAAVLGGVTSMPGAVVGGLILGVTVSFANETVLAMNLTSTVPGPPQVATFAVLVIVLIFRPKGLFGKEA